MSVSTQRGEQAKASTSMISNVRLEVTVLRVRARVIALVLQLGNGADSYAPNDPVDLFWCRSHNGSMLSLFLFYTTTGVQFDA